MNTQIMILIAILVGIIAIASWRQGQIKQSGDPLASIPENFQSNQRGRNGRRDGRDGRDGRDARSSRHYPRYPHYPRRYSPWRSWWPWNWNVPTPVPVPIPIPSPSPSPLTCNSYASQKCLNAVDYSDCYRIHNNQCQNGYVY